MKKIIVPDFGGLPTHRQSRPWSKKKKKRMIRHRRPYTIFFSFVVVVVVVGLFDFLVLGLLPRDMTLRSS